VRALLTLVSVLGIASHAARGELALPWPRIRRRPAVPAILTKLALLLASSLIVLLTLELVARVLVPMPWGQSEEELAKIATVGWSRYTFRPDAELGYIPTPNFDGRVVRLGEYDSHFHTNSLALRDREYGPKSSAAGRILAVGDSFVFGLGVQQSEPFAEVLERRLNRDYVGDYEVINAGVNGYAIDQYEGWMKRLLPQYQPDVVLVSIFVGNDFEPYVTKGELPYRREQVDDGYRVVFHSAFESWLAHHSHLGYFALHQLPKLTKRWDHLLGLLGRTDEPEDVAGVFASAVPYLDGIRAKAEASGAEVAFVIIPDRRQLGWTGGTKLADMDDYMRREVTSLESRFQTRAALLREYLESQGLRYLDLAPAIRARGAEKLYFQHDGHLNATGHSVVGKLLEDWVMDNFATALQRPAAPSEPMIARNGGEPAPSLLGPAS
jgi:lysophospholipase L1-like esterase